MSDFKKNTCILFCTHIINEHIINEYLKLHNSVSKEYDTFFVINNETCKIKNKSYTQKMEFFEKEVNCLFFDEELTKKLDFPLISDRENDFNKVCWYNGEYKYYYARHFYPDYKYYWCMEYDVFCNGDSYMPFFNKYKNSKDDLLIKNFRLIIGKDPWCWIPGTDWAYKDKQLVQSFFPISRLSGQAIDYLLKRRRELRTEFYNNPADGKRWIYCELFVPTELVNAGFSASNIDEKYIQLKPFEKPYFFLNKPDFALYHPVKDL